MKRRLLLLALAVSPAMGIASSFSSKGAGDVRRQREITEKFRENKKVLQDQHKGKPAAETDKTDNTGAEDSSKSGN